MHAYIPHPRRYDQRNTDRASQRARAGSKLGEAGQAPNRQEVRRD
ncbi:MAG: hypothetical protein RBU37_20950 [Myxococcota bacterium]|nr:hypothetical protein [Myxococcota bacterium]